MGFSSPPTTGISARAFSAGDTVEIVDPTTASDLTLVGEGYVVITAEAAASYTIAVQ